MLKQLFAGLFALVFTAADFSYFASPAANATNTPIIIDNVLSLCTTMLADGSRLNDGGTCDTYTATQTSATISRPIYVTGYWVLKNLDLTFTYSNAPFIIRSGSLTIEGGHYTSPSCVVWVQYFDGVYIPTTTITINSGVFEATVETLHSTDSPSPVCLITHGTVTPAEAERIIANYLPTGKRFVDIAPRLRTMRTAATDDSIATDDGYAHIDKDGNIRTEIKYLKTALVQVVGEPTPEPEPEESTPEEPTPDAPTEPVTPVIPKAPNTGRGK